MQENNVKANGNENVISIFNILYKNLFLIILITVIGLLAGVGVGILKSEPLYTATLRVMFTTKFSEEYNSAGNDVVLAKIYLPNAVDKVKSHIIIADANEIYTGEGSVRSDAITTSYVEESLIFSISYTDYSEEAAVAKLRAIIESAKANFPKPEFFVAKDATLREVENKAKIVEDSNFTTYVIVGALAGLVVAVAFFLIKDVTDNTVKDKEEFERITGLSVLACIDDAAVVEKRRLAKEKRAKKARRY